MSSSEADPESVAKSLGSLGVNYFDSLYDRSADGDPWRFKQSPYEAAKYAATLARLPRPTYPAALEVGCSVGVFTRMLADRVDRLLAIDIAQAPLLQAQDRCRDRPQVRLERANLLDEVPLGPFDLIVLAEVAYCWVPEDFDRVFRELVAQLTAGGQILLVHWRGPVPDYPQTGDATHKQAGILADDLGLNHSGRWVEEEYRTDLWERGFGAI